MNESLSLTRKTRRKREREAALFHNGYGYSERISREGRRGKRDWSGKGLLDVD